MIEQPRRLLSKIKYSDPIFMRFKTARRRVDVLNPHKDLLLMFYLLHKDRVTVVISIVFFSSIINEFDNILKNWCNASHFKAFRDMT